MVTEWQSGCPYIQYIIDVLMCISNSLHVGVDCTLLLSNLRSFYLVPRSSFLVLTLPLSSPPLLLFIPLPPQPAWILLSSPSPSLLSSHPTHQLILSSSSTLSHPLPSSQPHLSLLPPSFKFFPPLPPLSPLSLLFHLPSPSPC